MEAQARAELAAAAVAANQASAISLEGERSEGERPERPDDEKDNELGGIVPVVSAQAASMGETGKRCKILAADVANTVATGMHSTKPAAKVYEN